MKIAVSSDDGKRNSQFSQRLGRCNFFVIMDSESNKWESIPNPAVAARGGAGTQVVQFLIDHQVEVIITGRCGPNAFSAIKASGIQAYQGVTGTPEELVNRYLAGELSPISSSNRPGWK
jgi:predicted Fe-Mo cluster-binding NifX family protein